MTRRALGRCFLFGGMRRVNGTGAIGCATVCGYLSEKCYDECKK